MSGLDRRGKTMKYMTGNDSEMGRGVPLAPKGPHKQECHSKGRGVEHVEAISGGKGGS